PYQWGGTGPASFDCSGLVMRAWQAAGVNIPRVAADQYNFGTHVPISGLHIGDLVYWASDPSSPSTIEHVAMYIGGEHMVNAPYTGQVVRTDWIGGPGFVNLGSRP
ncbi:MAG: C40 family peptidase, partial [Acidimicrobiales bacterium]|nr:C40 family peptidase [Acidimicrobiales bacterium]